MSDEDNTFDAQENGVKIGPILEQARRERGLSLGEVEQATKIRKRYLQGLERDDYGALPDAIYAQGFLKTYANYLGLDGEELSRELKNRRKPRRERQLEFGLPKSSEFERPLIDPGGLRGTEKRSVSGAAVFALAVGVIALASVIGTLYFIGRDSQTTSERPESPPSEEAANRQEEGPGQGSDPKERPEPAANAGEEGAQGGEEDPPTPEVLRAVIRVEGAPSWLSIQSDGETAYEQIAKPGFLKTFEAERKLSISTGNAGAVEVEINGQNVGVLGDDGEVLTRKWTLKAES
jgi:cytoskeletal protein RodZ